MQSWWRSPTQPYGDDRLVGSSCDPLVLRMRAMRAHACVLFASSCVEAVVELLTTAGYIDA
jgi:hypothetical protein